MKRRLLKELRMLAPYLVGLALLQVGALWFASHPPIALPNISQQGMYAMWIAQMTALLAFGQFIALCLIGVGVFGWERDSETLDRLLSQPIARTRLWGEKTALLGAVVFVIVVANIGFVGVVSVSFLEFAERAARNYIANSLRLLIGTPLIAFASALLMGIVMRPVFTAFWAAIVLPAGSLALLMGAMSFLSSLSEAEAFQDALDFINPLGPGYLAFAVVWTAVLIPLSRLAFKRLEA